MQLSSLLRKPFDELTHRPAGQIPALDALRTFAVMCVIAAHMNEAFLKGGGSPTLFSKLPVVRGGWMGVDLFFVLSGYFIGKQLWRELRNSRTVNIKRFMLRRGLRIWPLYFFFLLFAGLVLRRARFPFGIWWSDPLFITNYVNRGVVMGSWSLCTEEQFYIAAPLLLILGACYSIPVADYRRYLWGLLFVLPVIRAVTWWHATGGFAHNQDLWFPLIYSPIHTHSDGLVMGLLIANYEVTSASRSRTGFLTSPWSVPVAVVVCLGLQKLQSETFDFTGLALVFGAATWFLLYNKSRWLGFLDSGLFYVLSRLSYGMYLNHEYLHEWVAKVILHDSPLSHSLPTIHEMGAVLLLTALSAAGATVTFCLVEWPFLQLRDRLLARPAAPALIAVPAQIGAIAAPAAELAPQSAPG
jgi:peptidoglycan/LPS O-acetylase OafA/YrhL